MARYRLTASAIIDGAYLAPGEEIEFDGIPGRHMQPLDKLGKEVPGPAPLDPLYHAYWQERSLPGVEPVVTGFYGFSSLSIPTIPELPPRMVDTPYLGGMGAVGEPLTCTMGNWTGEPTAYDYQWCANGMTVDEGEEATYVVQASDAGKTIVCIVTATNAVGSTQAAPSNGIDIPPAATRRA